MVRLSIGKHSAADEGYEGYFDRSEVEAPPEIHEGAKHKETQWESSMGQLTLIGQGRTFFGSEEPNATKCHVCSGECTHSLSPCQTFQEASLEFFETRWVRNDRID
ncbi:hypothetical protein RSSM_04991 [Rhodopirellula sallentina SM41]|uniref:Uncharacterized protein n=1 Tax=Rhodopirellula sallentina SM41 TaxID=1263870 RepID=M5TX03_9BACT|nr:hypothetical protein RSSM_04991 [Rhodopirellula sallentina SM41]